ncbi:MAG: hypothetical protein ISR69_13740 [Gammaproteobacteria bacterium]|nr:hypothetical protein [Gammaproteobacteria bacterium]
MKAKYVIGLSALLFSSMSMALFENNKFGAGVKTGTVGSGVDLSMTLSKKVNARLSLTSTDYDFSGESFVIGDAGGNQANVNADLNMNFGSTAILFDWYVFDGTFHVTGGLLKNNGSININGTVDGTVDLNGTTYNAGDIGNVGGSISAGESFEPYLGIGWGRKASVEKGLSISAEFGVVMMNPKASLTAELTNSSATQTQKDDLSNNIKSAESDINSDLSSLELFPVLSVGLNYAF